MDGSVLELRVPADQLDLDGDGSGRCRIISPASGGAGTDCSAVSEGQEHVLTTPAVIGAPKGSTLKLSISGVFANQRQVTFSNSSIRVSISNE